MSDRTEHFEWSGGHPALDLVNTLDERPFPSPIENLATYRDLVRFATSAELINSSIARALQKLSGPACNQVAKRVRELRESLHELLAATLHRRPAPDVHLAAITAAIQAAHAARELAMSTSSRLASKRWSDPADPNMLLHACALAVEDLLINVDRTNLRKCGAPDCGVFFVDTSKAHRRQWCSMKNCGNREKQRRWRSG
jgi:predicted RNA-binding Zn ribbon-like protein